MRTWMATAAAIALLAGMSAAPAWSAPGSPEEGAKTMQQSAAPRAKVTHKSTAHQAMRMKHSGARETTGFGGRTGAIGGPRNDPSIHQSVGDRDSRDYPKQR